MLKPSEQYGRNNRPRPLNEHEQGKQRREKEKADYYRRNPDKKWNE